MFSKICELIFRKLFELILRKIFQLIFKKIFRKIQFYTTIFAFVSPNLFYTKIFTPIFSAENLHTHILPFFNLKKNYCKNNKKWRKKGRTI